VVPREDFIGVELFRCGGFDIEVEFFEGFLP